MITIVVWVCENISYKNGHPYSDLPDFIDYKDKVFYLDITEEELKKLYNKRKDI